MEPPFFHLLWYFLLHVMVVFDLIAHDHSIVLSQPFIYMNISPSGCALKSDLLHQILCELGLLTNYINNSLLVIVFSGEFIPPVHILLRVVFLIKSDSIVKMWQYTAQFPELGNKRGWSGVFPKHAAWMSLPLTHMSVEWNVTVVGDLCLRLYALSCLWQRFICKCPCLHDDLSDGQRRD